MNLSLITQGYSVAFIVYKTYKFIVSLYYSENHYFIAISANQSYSTPKIHYVTIHKATTSKICYFVISFANDIEHNHY